MLRRPFTLTEQLELLGNRGIGTTSALRARWTAETLLGVGAVRSMPLRGFR